MKASKRFIKSRLNVHESCSQWTSRCVMLVTVASSENFASLLMHTVTQPIPSSFVDKAFSASEMSPSDTRAASCSTDRSAWTKLESIQPMACTKDQLLLSRNIKQKRQLLATTYSFSTQPLIACMLPHSVTGHTPGSSVLFSK